MPVVMLAIDAEQVVEVTAAEDQATVETVAPQRAYPALGVRVRVRRLHRRVDDLDRLAAEDVVEAAAELAVAIMDQEAERLPAGRRVRSAGSAPAASPTHRLGCSSTRAA